MLISLGFINKAPLNTELYYVESPRCPLQYDHYPTRYLEATERNLYLVKPPKCGSGTCH